MFQEQVTIVLRSKFYQRGFSYAVIVLAVMLMLALLLVGYQFLLSKSRPGYEELEKENRFLQKELDLMVQRSNRNQARLAVLEQEAEVIRKANRLLREEEANRQAEINRMQSELDFYSRLAGTGGEQAGLAVYRVELTPTESPLVFRFILTLTQNIRRASIISGKASIDVEGTLEDRPVTLYWSQLTEDTVVDNSFRFKYFQQLEGYLTLPEAFSPTRLVVSLDAKGQRKPLTVGFDWQELLVDSSVD
jgi:hypothetical protein